MSRKPSLTGAYWTVDALPPNRVNVAPDSWLDLDHYARVVAARQVRPYLPLPREVPS
mgnify:CR=1 FL=1